MPEGVPALLELGSSAFASARMLSDQAVRSSSIHMQGLLGLPLVCRTGTWIPVPAPVWPLPAGAQAVGGGLVQRGGRMEKGGVTSGSLPGTA